MKVKVCQISSAHRRYDARIFRKIASSLAKFGYDSYFLICDTLPNEEKDGVHIISNGYRARNHFSRIFLSWRKLKKLALKIDAEIYQIHDPELFNLGFYLKKKGKIVIFDCHEDYRYISEKKYLPKIFRKLILKIYLKKEKRVCEKFDAVITVTPTVRDRLKEFSRKMVMITNYPILTNRIQHKFDGERTLCFGGNCGWMHSTLISVLPQFKGNVKYNFITNTNDPDLLPLKQINGWEYVNLLPYMPFEELRKIYASSWAGFALFPYCAVVNYDEGTLGNTKIFEYMMDGLPVICSDHKIWKQIIEENECGIPVNPYDKDGLEKAIKTLLFDKELLKKMSENGRRAAEKKYNWGTQETILLNLYQELLNNESKKSQ